MRLIDVDAFGGIVKEGGMIDEHATVVARNAMLAMPTVDAVPMIRCKDCKYYRADGDCWHEWDNDGRIYYQSIINEPNPDDYCSRAKRKEE